MDFLLLPAVTPAVAVVVTAAGRAPARPQPGYAPSMYCRR
mgnify:CR=1 FL=1